MNNEDSIQYLLYRRDRIKELIPLQTLEDAKDLLAAEKMYVEATIEFRSKHGGMEKIKLSPDQP